MDPQFQDQIIYLMFLNGCLFLGLNYIGFVMIYPGPTGSKRQGYGLIVAALLAFVVTHEHKVLSGLGFSDAHKILIGGFVVPVFLLSLVAFRIRRQREERKTRIEPREDHDGN